MSISIFQIKTPSLVLPMPHQQYFMQMMSLLLIFFASFFCSVRLSLFFAFVRMIYRRMIHWRFGICYASILDSISASNFQKLFSPKKNNKSCHSHSNRGLLYHTKFPGFFKTSISLNTLTLNTMSAGKVKTGNLSFALGLNSILLLSFSIIWSNKLQWFWVV